jgi:hypothetical protein
MNVDIGSSPASVLGRKQARSICRCPRDPERIVWMFRSRLSGYHCIVEHLPDLSNEWNRLRHAEKCTPDFLSTALLTQCPPESVPMMVDTGPSSPLLETFTDTDPVPVKGQHSGADTVTLKMLATIAHDAASGRGVQGALPDAFDRFCLPETGRLVALGVLPRGGRVGAPGGE